MLVLRSLEYYQLVLCEVSRLYVKKCLRKTPVKTKCVWKKYNGENGLQRKAILCGVIPGKIKNITNYQIEILSTTNQMNILAGNLQQQPPNTRKKLAAKKYREKKC